MTILHGIRREAMTDLVLLHHPDTMALPPGIYTIKNVKYHNWAMLLDGNEGEVVSGSSDNTNVGEKVSLLKM